MKKNLFFLSTIALMACLVSINASAQTKAQPAAIPQLGKSPVKDVVKAMTLEEKSKLVVGMGFKMPGAPKPTAKQMKEGVDNLSNPLCPKIHPIHHLDSRSNPTDSPPQITHQHNHEKYIIVGGKIRDIVLAI